MPKDTPGWIALKDDGRHGIAINPMTREIASYDGRYGGIYDDGTLTPNDTYIQTLTCSYEEAVDAINRGEDDWWE